VDPGACLQLCTIRPVRRRSIGIDEQPSESAWLLALVFHFAAFTVVGAMHRLGRHEREAVGRFPSIGVLAGILLCAIIEVGQLAFPGRHPEVADFCANVLGLTLGYVAMSTPARAKWIFGGVRSHRAVVPGLDWTSALLLPLQLVRLDGWYLTYPLVIGNEQSGESAWRSELRHLAFYADPLETPQVQALMAVPPATPQGQRSCLDEGLLASYDFSRIGESAVTPAGPLSIPELTLQLPADARWTAGSPSALILVRPT
jgi:hypothetical protein